MPKLDVITIGRSSVDLYGAQIGGLKDSPDRGHDGFEQLGEVEGRDECLGDLGQRFELVRLSVAFEVRHQTHEESSRRAIRVISL